MPNYDQLADYGLTGLVILGLLYLIKFGFTKFESIVNTFSLDFKELQNDHRQDRKQWYEATDRKAELDKQSQERRDSAIISSLDSLKDAIKDQNKRKREYN